jgi:predicted nucleotidyltransferase
MRTKSAGESALLLLDVIETLREHSIDYAVVGAMAAAVHGVIRASQDADIIVSLAVRELNRMKDVYADLGFLVEVRRGGLDDPIQALLEIRDTFDNRVDLIVGIKGLPVETFKRSIDVAFSGERIRVVGREDFIAMKVFASGPQDLSDARQVLAINAGHIDFSLLKLITERYGREARANLSSLLGN